VKECPSRMERLYERVEQAAERGKWSLYVTLYPSEIKRIERQWHVSVQTLKSENNRVACVICWNNAFPDGLTYKQAWYVSKLLEEIPDEMTYTYAQRLFLMAARA